MLSPCFLPSAYLLTGHRSQTHPRCASPLRRAAAPIPIMTAAAAADSDAAAADSDAAAATSSSGSYPKPISPPYPPISKEIELSRAEAAELRSSSFALSASDIVFEDEWMVVVNKPAGIYCETLLSWLADTRPEGTKHASIALELHMANRLDRDTSGLMIITKSHKAAAKLVKAFTDHNVKKTYLALCTCSAPYWSRIKISSGHGRSKFGAWRVYAASDVGRILPGGSRVKHMATSFELLCVNGRGELRQPAELGMDSNESVVVEDARSINSGEEQDEVLIRAYPQSGRSHQIRLHCQYIGAPIRGDVKYGGVDQWRGVSCEGHALHAESLAFEHPITGLPVRFQAPMPMWVSEHCRTIQKE